MYGKKLPKVFLALWFFFAAANTSLFAKSLQSIKTNYFEIIYAEPSAPSAALLAEYADGYAEEISAALQQKIKRRIPVYLVSDTEELNGYFTQQPYARIVIYDTGITDGQLGNLTDTLLQVFYHELTHALTLRTSLMNILPMSFTEGAAVSFESLSGQGRLHDPLIKQYLIQNKIDGTTPTWQEAAGARDMYPGGLWPYIYGGYFSDYLQKKYGMEAYSKLWKLGWRLFAPLKFYSIYKQDIRTEWNKFISTIPLPEKLNEPIPFAAQREQSVYTALAANKDGFAYYDFDRQAVYFTAVSNDGTASAPVKLFTADFSLNHLSFSDDGMLLAVSDSIGTSAKTMQKRTRIFDMKRRQFTGTSFLSSMAACFIDSQTLCAVMLKNQQFSVTVLDRDTQEAKKVLYTAGPGQTFAALYNPCYIGKGRVALVAANGVKRTLLFIDTETGALSLLPEQEAPYAIRYLQSVKTGDEYVLTFSWAEQDMLYRLGLYYPESGMLKTQQIDVSGGVFFPVIVPKLQTVPHGSSSPIEAGAKDDETETHSVIYAGRHSAYNRLYTMPEPHSDARIVQPAALSAQAARVPASKPPNLEFLSPGKYHPAAWLWRAKVLPTVSIPGNIWGLGGYGFGITLAMLDPAEKIEINSSFMMFPKPFFMQGIVNTAFHFKPLSLHMNAFDLLEAQTFTHRKTGFEIGISSFIPLSYSWETMRLSYKGMASWIAPLSKERNTYYPLPYRYTVLAHEGQLRYRNIRSSRVAKSPFFAQDIRGITVSGSATHAYCVEKNAHAAVFQAATTGYFPIVPITLAFSGALGINAQFNPISGAYTQSPVGSPVTSTHYFPFFAPYNTDAVQQRLTDMQTDGLWGGVSGVCDITLFSCEVQSGGYIAPLFLNRIAFHTGYAGMLAGYFGLGANGRLYLDTVYLNCLFTFNGGLAEVGMEYAHPMRTPKQSGSWRVIVNVAL